MERRRSLYSSLEKRAHSTAMHSGRTKLLILAMARARYLIAFLIRESDTSSPFWAASTISSIFREPLSFRIEERMSDEEERCSALSIMDFSLEYDSRHPLLPHTHIGPSGFITICPTSPSPVTSPNLDPMELRRGHAIPVDTYIYASNDKISELIALFGDKWKKETLLAMNKELDDMIVQYGGSREELPTMDLYCELIRLKWLAREQMDSGNVTQGKQLLAERNKMLKENGMTVQAMKEKKSSDSFGVDIDYVEYRPIRPKKKYSDYSGLMHMFKYFITHQERFYGDNQKPIDDDYEEMDKYKKSHPKEYKAEMFPDDYDFTKEDEEIEEE